MARQPVIWVVLAVMAVAAAVVTLAEVKDTHDRVLKVEREACRTERSCQTLLNRLLRYASSRQKRAIVQSLPNIRERLRRQIPPEDRPAPPRRFAPRGSPDPANPSLPQEPGSAPPAVGPRGPTGPTGPKGEPGKPAPAPPPVTVPEVPAPAPLPELPPLPQPVCDLLPTLCPSAP